MAAGAIPGALGGDLGTILAQGSKMGPTNREKLVPFCYQNRDSYQLFVVLFLGCFFLTFVGSISSPFLASRWDLWAFGKPVESVVRVRVVNCRGLTLPRQNLFAALGCRCVSIMFFCRFSIFFAVLGCRF